MHKVISATTNPAKIQVTLRVFEEIFGEGSCHIEPVAVESGVLEQPSRNRKMYTGVQNRVVNAHRLYPQADFWVTIEAGIDDNATSSWVVIDSGIQRDEARSTTLSSPTVIPDRVRKDETLGPVMSDYTGINGVGRKEGAIGAFTAGKLMRLSVYHQAVILALSPFHNVMHDELL